MREHRLQKVALRTPCLRQTSAVPSPASCSFNIEMICSSLNLLRFMRPPSIAADSTKIWRRSRGSGHRQRQLALQKPLSELKPKSKTSAPARPAQPRPAPAGRALTAVPCRGLKWGSLFGSDSISMMFRIQLEWFSLENHHHADPISTFRSDPRRIQR